MHLEETFYFFFKFLKCLTLKVVFMWSDFEDSEDQKLFAIREKSILQGITDLD